MSQQRKTQKMQDNRYVNQGAEPEVQMGKTLSPQAAQSPSHATETSETRNSRARERAKPAYSGT